MAEPLVIVLGHPQFYSRFGFQPAINYNIQSPFVPAEFFMVNFLQAQDFKGKVVYPSTFEEV